MSDEPDVSTIRARGQITGFLACLVLVGALLGGWAASGGHLVLTRPGPSGGLVDATIVRVF